MGGDITATSTLGCGSSFRLEVLVKVVCNGDTSGMVSAGRIQRIKEDAHLCILVVDDEEENLSLYGEMLGSVGFDLKMAKNGSEAIALFTQWHPEVIIMDSRMPEMSGSAAIEAIRVLPGGRRVKIITISAYVTDDHQRQSIELGADVFLAKPFRMVELFDKIRLLTGIEYLHAKNLSQDESLPKPLPLTPETFVMVDPPLKKEIYEAAIRCRTDRLIQLFEECSVIDAATRESLQSIIGRYDYETLTELFT